MLTKKEYLDILDFMNFFYGINLIATAGLRAEKSKELQKEDEKNFFNKICQLSELVEAYFDNQPLKFEELCNLIQNDRNYCFIPIWDNKFKCWRLLRNALHTQEGLKLIFQECKNVYFKYEENRFYRKQGMEK